MQLPWNLHHLETAKISPTKTLMHLKISKSFNAKKARKLPVIMLKNQPSVNSKKENQKNKNKTIKPHRMFGLKNSGLHRQTPAKKPCPPRQHSSTKSVKLHNWTRSQFFDFHECFFFYSFFWKQIKLNTESEWRTKSGRSRRQRARRNWRHIFGLSHQYIFQRTCSGGACGWYRRSILCSVAWFRVHFVHKKHSTFFQII